MQRPNRAPIQPTHCRSISETGQMTKTTTGTRKTTREPLETLKLTITALDKEGVGVAGVGPRTALVQGAFPGETVVAGVEHTGRTHIFTRLQKVLRNAPERTAQCLCPIELTCLGCPIIGMTYQAQLRYKQQRVETALLEQLPGEHVQVAAVLPSPQTSAYRTSAKLVFARKRNKILLGLYRRGSHEVIDIPACAVHHPLINRIAGIVREDVLRQGISIYNPRQKQGLLRYLMVRISPDNQRALVTFVCNFKDYQQLPRLAKMLVKKVPEVIGVHQNINSSTGNVILGNETFKLLGHPDLIEQVGAIRLHIAPESFFQINTRQAARMYALICDWAGLTSRDSAVDLFCGIGGIALHLARSAGRVRGIEMVPEAVRNATANAALNKLTNCSFSTGDATLELERMVAGGAPPPSLVTLNPPRKGCGEALLEQLLLLRPRQIIYVSCDPDTLAQDLRRLVGGGYRILRLQPLDMFPQTAHVETLVQLIHDATR